MISRLFDADPGGTGGSGAEGSQAERTARIERELDSLRKLHRCVLDTTQSALVMIDEKGAIVDCNARCEEAAGASVEVIRTMKWDDFVAPEDLDRLHAFFRDRARGTGHAPSTYTFRFLSASGSSTYMEAHVGLVPESGWRVVSLTDLSEIVRAQHRTAESEDRYRTVVESTRDGILICREDTVLFANPTFCDLAGWSREDIYAMNPLQLFHPAERDRLIALLHDPAGSVQETPAPWESVILRRDGSAFPGEVSPVRIAFRGSPAALLTIRDLTQRKLAEKRMRENHQLLKAIVDHSPIAVSVHDRNGTLLMANGAWRTIWGKTEADQERLMQQPRERLRMDRRDNYLSGYLTQVERVYREGGELLIPQLRISNPPPGGAEWISHHFYAIMDDRHEVDKVVVLTVDLTDILRTRERLEESEGQYRELVENTPVAIYRTSIDRGGRLLSANPAMLRLFAIPEDGDPDDVRIDSFYVDESRRREFLEVVSRGEPVENFEAELRRLDGTTFLASISARGRYDRDGNVTCIEGIIRDITDLRRAELEIRRSESLSSLGALAGEIAHDFNNLLMGIRGSIGRAMADSGESRRSAHLRRAAEAVDEATDLAGQLLSFSGGEAPDRQPMDLGRVLRDSASAAVAGTVVALELDIAPDTGTLLADSGQIGQVVRNLVLNAVQAMPGGGTVRIRTGRRHLEADEVRTLGPGTYVVVTVADDGPGIPPENLSMVFTPYFSTRPGASGLGLAICYSVVRRHGGLIEIASGPGRGTEIRVFLPASPVSAAAPPPGPGAVDAAVAASGARILVMDDVPLVREVLCGMLVQLGYRAEECADGEEAVEIYREALSSGDRFAAAILDLTIPGGPGGVRTLEMLRELDPEVRAIVSSGYSNDPVIRDYAGHGFAGSLTKPFTEEVLDACVRAVLSLPENPS